jgi:hypothetical protein
VVDTQCQRQNSSFRTLVQLAEDLVSQGIQVILDKWDLKPGHDAHAFMEGMVTNPTVTKAIMVFDRNMPISQIVDQVALALKHKL